jgi:hypothetical protein
MEKINKYGITDIYKDYKKDGGKVDKKTFRKVLNSINKALFHLILYEGFDFKIPYRLGNFVIYLKKNIPKLDENGNLKKNSLPVNWKETLQLWEENEEARREKKLIYYTNKYIGKLYWDKRTCMVKNQRFFDFRLMKQNRSKMAEFLREMKTVIYYEYPYTYE